MTTKLEYRTLATALRAAPETRFTLEGTAASYNRLSKDLGGFRERLLPGCFTRSLASPDSDVIFTLNHDISKVLGRTKSGTLKLIDTPKGLSFRCQLDPSNSDHVNLRASVKRGDISECSFAFAVDGDGDDFDTATDAEKRSFTRRSIKHAKLFDVAAVTRPAYGDGATSVVARSADYLGGFRVPRTGDVWAAERAELARIDAKHRGDLHGGPMTPEEIAYWRAAFAKQMLRCAADEEDGDEYDGPFESQSEEDEAFEQHQHLAARAKREGK